MVTLAVFKVCLWVLSLLSASVCFASDPWITCTDDNRLITVNTGDQIRIRSQNWPDSMVVRSQNQGGRTTTRCRIQLEHKLKLQFIVITILSGNLGFGVGSQVIVDTNSDSVDNIPNVRASCPFRNKVCLFEIDQGTNNYTANTNLWSGFEAIVTAYENEKECPFDTASDEEFTILENGKEVLKANATHPPSNFVFYTKTDFTITYNRVRRQPADGNIVAVISSYPAEPVSYQAPTCSESSGITTVTKDSPVSLTNNPMSSVLTAYENYQVSKLNHKREKAVVSHGRK
ncbi:hypothetical protein L596_000635 [Steinernema carpocapsae]|uniref:Uncharacterized protein n=1 Tax=Steinernema carpocapsae TaxID=34508 RepID=A0A4U8UL27_STECR|nr:hypothetical protein L596_000635 [Steinernema carpocapsae]